MFSGLDAFRFDPIIQYVILSMSARNDLLRFILILDIQEEILFATYPELFAAMIFFPKMAPNEAVEIRGVQCLLQEVAHLPKTVLLQQARKP